MLITNPSLCGGFSYARACFLKKTIDIDGKMSYNIVILKAATRIKR